MIAQHRNITHAKTNGSSHPVVAMVTQPIEMTAEDLLSLRKTVHRLLIASIEEEGFEALADTAAVGQRVDQLIDEIEAQLERPIAENHRNQVRQKIVEDVGGFGPLAHLMVDSSVSDILVNGPDEIWVDRGGVLKKTELCFDDRDHLRRILDRLVAAQGKRLDARSPTVDARLPDGSRLHAVIAPLCSDGPVISIRKFCIKPQGTKVMVTNGFASRAMMSYIKAMVTSRINIVIAGGAAAGKTTLLNSISRYIPANERLVTVEETAELNLEHPHVVALEGRSDNSEGVGEFGLRKLVHTALRMRADRIIVGEVRGGEALDMLQAMNVGHDGSLTTVHANDPKAALRRLETLALTSGDSIPRAAIREMIGTAVQVVIQIARFNDGCRRIVSISEVQFEGDDLRIVEVFKFIPVAAGADGKTHGEFVCTQQPSALLEQLRKRGFRYNEILGRIHATDQVAA